MKRILSTCLILMFWLVPLAEALPARSESRLPACCRRHGAHHCAMSVAMASMADRASRSSASYLTTPLHCPNFPTYADEPTTPVDALAAAATGLPVLLAQDHLPAASDAAARQNHIRICAGRGPPSSLFG
jgi:hypothetical protein